MHLEPLLRNGLNRSGKPKNVYLFCAFIVSLSLAFMDIHTTFDHGWFESINGHFGCMKIVHRISFSAILISIAPFGQPFSWCGWYELKHRKSSCFRARDQCVITYYFSLRSFCPLTVLLPCYWYISSIADMFHIRIHATNGSWDPTIHARWMCISIFDVRHRTIRSKNEITLSNVKHRTHFARYRLQKRGGHIDSFCLNTWCIINVR